MFNKTRKKFILISMTAITFVIFLILSATNGFYYIQKIQDSDQIISFIMENKNIFSQGPISYSGSSEDPSPGLDFDDRFGPNSGNNIRYFTVMINQEETRYNLNFIDDVSEEEANDLVEMATNLSKNSGFLNDYRYCKSENNDFFVFLYCGKDIESLNEFRNISIICSASGLILSFIFVYLFSGVVLKPVKDTYDKQKQFISNASHELKTPLTIISTNNELLELKNGPNEYTETINKEINKMTSMTKKLTTLAKFREKDEVKLHPVNLSNLLTEVIEPFQILFKKENKKVLIDCPNEININTNEDFFSEIISILLDNSLKYAKTYTSIKVHKEKKSVVLIASNDCESIEEGNLSHYLERFYRSSHSRTKVAGSGIGLSIASELAKLLGIVIEVYGENNTFNFKMIIPNK